MTIVDWLSHAVTQVAGDVCWLIKIPHEQDYPGIIVTYDGYKKTWVKKSGRQGGAQEGPWIPQGYPMGPKYLVNFFSLATSSRYE